jgi:hypothetical protein
MTIYYLSSVRYYYTNQEITLSLAEGEADQILGGDA